MDTVAHLLLPVLIEACACCAAMTSRAFGSSCRGPAAADVPARAQPEKRMDSVIAFDDFSYGATPVR
jgi:hypothetical protein